MPRIARVDYPGALHHVMGRGIERRYVLAEPEEKSFFLERLKELCRRYDFRCYAWCLMDNHYHLLLETGPVPLKKLMSGLLTSYGLYYNRTHRRVGHVFQNRYQSILCEKEAYLLELVRYIHLNPVKADMLELSRLRGYRWCGHHELLNEKSERLIEQEYVLECFSKQRKQAIRAYSAFMREGLDCSQDYEGGGLKRSLTAKVLSQASMKPEERINYDQRILGCGEFVDQVLSRAENIGTQERQVIEFEDLAKKVQVYYNIGYEELFGKQRTFPYREARLVLIYLANGYSDIANQRVLGQYFGISRTAISMALKQGRQLCQEKPLEEAILTL